MPLAQWCGSADAGLWGWRAVRLSSHGTMGHQTLCPLTAFHNRPPDYTATP
jgi:hypothetical protein